MFKNEIVNIFLQEISEEISVLRGMNVKVWAMKDMFYSSLKVDNGTSKTKVSFFNSKFK